MIAEDEFAKPVMQGGRIVQGRIIVQYDMRSEVPSVLLCLPRLTPYSMIRLSTKHGR